MLSWSAVEVRSAPQATAMTTFHIALLWEIGIIGVLLLVVVVLILIGIYDIGQGLEEVAGAIDGEDHGIDDDEQ